MTITATELKLNLGKYLEMSRFEDIFITKNSKTIARLSNPANDRVASLNALVGIVKDVPAEITDDEIKKERLARQ